MRLELDRITVSYGGLVALREVSLTVPAGTVVALLGPNGAGKTTLLRAASGMVGLARGQVRIDGAVATGWSADRFARAGVCHVTEGRSVFPGLTVRENLRMFARPGEERDSIERAAAAFPRLGQRMNQIAGTMSGGEQQMLALSRAYVRQAPMVLLDETSMGLAPIIVDEIFEFFGRLTRQGTSLLLVEQYATKALDLADKVYLLARGRIAYAAEPGEIAGTDMVAHYLGAGAVAHG
jgi:branched-chain amino acid transport system ATP-binding protein